MLLRKLYECPIINYFEYFYHTRDSDLDFRPDFPSPMINRLRARVRNATLLLDLDNCDVGYSPTRWQRDLLPKLFHEKVRVWFSTVWTRRFGGRCPTCRARLASGRCRPTSALSPMWRRGMESIRGFDIFLKTAKRLYQQRDDVFFVIVGEDRICYGGDADVTGKPSFKEWVLEQDKYDLSKFLFTGLLPTPELVKLFSLSDLHIYLTVPFVLSWSLIDALACGTTVLASQTAPVREMIRHNYNGLLADFFDVDTLADTSNRVLDAPGDYKHLGRAGVEMIRERYSLAVCLPQMLKLYQDAVAAYRTVERGTQEN